MPDDFDENGAEVSDAMSENEYDDDDLMKDDLDKMGDANTSDNGNGEGAKKRYDPKDPLRPRRKKARRACFACQRAHLTCGKFLMALYHVPALWRLSISHVCGV